MKFNDELSKEGNRMGSHPPVVLAIAHPGHELRVFGWIHLVRPIVFVLTDGAGSTGRSRLPATSRILAAAGAKPGQIYGRLTDRFVYRAILNADTGLFQELADELAEVLVVSQVGFVAGDAIEGYNPAHDVWRLVINAAVRLAAFRGSRRIENRDFPLIGPPDHTGSRFSRDTKILTLNPSLFEKKLLTAQAYQELTGEVNDALQTIGDETFRRECLRVAPATQGTDGLGDEKPFYEVYGERKVAKGIYRAVIRRQAHVLPIARSLSEYVDRATG